MRVDGEIRALSVLKFPLIDARGNAYAVCGIANDVTERKHWRIGLTISLIMIR